MLLLLLERGVAPAIVDHLRRRFARFKLDAHPSGFAMPAFSGFRESFNFLCLSLAVIFCLAHSSFNLREGYFFDRRTGF
jgi:hypothetical protein